MKYDYQTGTPIEFSPMPKEKTYCDLCFEQTDDFEVVAITASLSITVCRVCLDQDPVEYESIINFVKDKQLWKSTKS